MYRFLILLSPYNLIFLCYLAEKEILKNNKHLSERKNNCGNAVSVPAHLKEKTTTFQDAACAVLLFVTIILFY